MKSKVMLNYIADNIWYTLLFFGNSLLIALFYALTTGREVELLYPLTLSAFIFGVFAIVRWSTYYPFSVRIDECVDDAYRDIPAATCEQRKASDAINRIHKRYTEELSAIHLQNRNNKQFLSQWIHSMKTPISVIDLVVQKCRRGDMPSDEATVDIAEENDRLLVQLNQILNLLRLDDFSRDYLPERIDLGLSVKKAIHAKKSQFVYNKVFPKVRLPNEPVYVLTDAKWHEVILEQIITNAIKYSGNRDESKSVFFELDESEQCLVLKIRDEGIGIPEHDLGRVFDAFFTGENGRSQKNATGIGLYLCSAIAQRLGHRIDIRSSVGVGTEVTITYLSRV